MTAQGVEINVGEMVLHHTADAYSLDFYPIGHIERHRWPDLHLGPLTLNLTPSKHVVAMILTSALVFLTMWLAGRKLERQRAGQYRSALVLAAVSCGNPQFPRRTPDEISASRVSQDDMRVYDVVMAAYASNQVLTVPPPPPPQFPLPAGTSQE